MRKLNILYVYILVVLIITQSCSEFLDEKPDKQLAVPSSLDDFQALMNETHVVNISPAEGEVSADDLYLTDSNFDGLNCQYEWDLYLWKDGPMTDLCYGRDGWRMAYTAIYHYNTIIEGLKNYKGLKDQRYYDLLGQAFFYRGLTYLELAVIFLDAYDAGEAPHKLGLPLRKTTDFNERSVRSSMEETFESIISDLKLASLNLTHSRQDKFKPTKSAAQGALARAYLYMGDFTNARIYADSVASGKELINYAFLDANSAAPFDRLSNREMILERYLFGYMSLYPGIFANVSPELYSLYDDNDWRKNIFFTLDKDGMVSFKGSYGGLNMVNYSGIALDEIYLILAESLYRTGNINNAMSVMDVFLSNRYREGTKPLLTAKNLLEVILQERRKQLIFRGIRFSDIKRLNKLGDEISLKRVMKGKEYLLPAHDPRFAILIPLEIIQRSGIEQNPR